MNREIKFRGIVAEPGGNWVYGNLVICDNGDCTIGNCPRYGGIYYRNEVYPDSVGQYTGIHDKNGVEIYEGDIVRYTYHGEDGEPNEYKSKKGVMNFKENQWCINSKHLDKYTMNFFYLEVIGNIFENKELLEDENN